MPPIDPALKEFGRRVVLAMMRGASQEVERTAGAGAEQVLGRVQTIAETALETVRATREAMARRRSGGGA